MIFFLFQVPKPVWPEDKEVSGCRLDDYLKKYQNPVETDPMMKVQNELDETKIVLHNTIEACVVRQSWSCQAHFALSSLDQLQPDFDILSNNCPRDTHSLFALWPNMWRNLKKRGETI